jgi:hypothetical protein
MFITDQYNNLPESILSRIPKLTGQMVKFEVRGKYWDKANNMWRYPHLSAIPKTDRIVDRETNDVYTIANVHNISSSGEPVMPMILFDHSGHIIIRPNENGQYSSSDILTYQYLMLCNYNESNPHRDSNTKPWFKQINDDAIALGKVEEKSQSADAVRMVAKINDDEVLLLAAQLGVGEVGDLTQVLRFKLVEYAEKNPVKAQAGHEIISNLGVYIEDIERGIDRKIIALDRRNNSYKWLETKAEFYAATKGISAGAANASLARWFKTTQEGTAAYGALKKALEA